MAGAGRLDVSLGLNAAEYTRGLGKAAQDAEKFNANLLKTARQTGEALAAFFSVRAFAGLIQGSIDAADKLNDLSKATGVSVEQIGGIGFAAKQAGSDLDTAATAFSKLNLKIAEAARGEKEASEAFKALGISVKDAAGNTKSADVIFSEIATKFEKFADGPEKAALSNAFFSKSFKEMAPLLADGGQALQDNIAYFQKYSHVTAESAKAADEFNDTIGKLKLVVQGFVTQLTNALLPGLQVVANSLLSTAENTDLVTRASDAAREAFGFFAERVAIASTNFRIAGISLGGLLATLDAIKEGNFKGIGAIFEGVSEDIKKTIADLDSFSKKIKNATAAPVKGIGLENLDQAIGRAPTVRKPTAPRLSGPDTKVKKEVDEVEKAYEAYVRQLTQAIERESELSEVQKLTFALQQGALRQLTDDRKAALLFLAQEIDAHKEYNKTIAENARLQNAVNEENERFQKSIDSLTGRAQMRQDLQALKDLDEALQAGIISLEEFKVAQNKIAGFDKELEKSNDAAEELGLTFSSALEDAIVDFNSLRDIVKGLEKDLLRIGTRKLVTEPLANWATELFKGMGSGGGSGGAGIGGILGAIFGGANLSGVFASGTDFVPRDGLAYLHRGERVIDADSNRKGGGGMVVNNQFVLPAGGVSRETQNQIALRAGQAIRQAQSRNA